MKLKTVLLSGASLLAMTVHAHSLEAIGSLVISGLLSVGAGGLLPVASATAIGLATIGVAGAVANLALQAAFLGRRPSVDPNELKNTTQGSEGPGRYAFGRVKVAGQVAFGNSAGYNIYRLLLACFGPISAIEEYFYDNRSVTVDPDGAVTSPPWATSGGTNLYLKAKLGTGTETAWPDLVTDFSTLWTSDHRVRGIGQVLVKAINPGTANARFPTLFQGGLKSVVIKARVGEFYDPRDASTAWSINGVLHCLHWLRRLPGISDAIIDFDDIKGVVDQGEATVPTLTGTAPRCQLSGGWQGPLTHDIVRDMLESSGLEMRRTATGKWTFAFIEDWPEPEITFRAKHIIDIFPQSGPEGAKRPNICKLKYFSPERGYEVSEIDLTNAPWAKVQEEIDVYGEQEFPVELIFCADASQAQRIARRLFHMARADFGILKTKFSGLAKWGKKTALIEIPDVGEDGESIFVRVRLGSARSNDDEGTCEIPFTIIPDILATAWNPATDEVPAPPILPDFQYESELDTPAPPTQATVVQYPGGGAYETRIRFTGVAGGTTAEANYRTYTAGLPDAWASMTEYQGVSGAWFGWVSGDNSGDADFRARFFNADGDGSYFSDVLEERPLDIDNTATGAPAVTSETTTGDPIQFDLDMIVPETRAVQLVVEERIIATFTGEWTVVATMNDLRPDILRTFDKSYARQSSNYTVEWRVSSRTSNGTIGAYASGSFTVSGTG